jgi:23S rRNA (uracil1939-C5)-methyltransferase
MNPIIGAPDEYHYRNKLEYTFTNRAWLTQDQIDSGAEIDRRAAGFHVPGRFDGVMQIDTCYLQENKSNDIRNFVLDLGKEKGWTFYNMSAHEGFLRNLIVRNTSIGEWMVIMSVAEDDSEKIETLMSALADRFPEIQSLNYVVNSKMNDTLYDQDIICYKGAAFITEQLGHRRYKIGPKSFFQTNSRQASTLYDIARKMARLSKEDIVYDLYTGTGTIALYMADDCKKVVGIETVEAAIEDAKENASLNGVQNADFVAAQVEKILDASFLKEHGKPDVVITDPPRAGMHDKVLEVLLEGRSEENCVCQL